MTGLGTAIDVAAILLGGGIGTAVGGRLPVALRETAVHALGIVVLLFGIQNFLAGDSVLVPLASVVIGLVVGELLGLEAALERFGNTLEAHFSAGRSPVGQAFVTASLLFCVGPLAVLGSFEDGLHGDYRLLAVKSAIDGVTALSFASVLGWGVLLSAVPVLVVQGTLTFSASLLEPVVTEPVILALTATGGVLLALLALGMLEVKRVRVANMLPALLIAPLLVAAGRLWPFT